MYINKFKRRENFFILLIIILIFEYQLSFVHTFFVDRIIKISTLVFLIIFYGNFRENTKNIYIQKITLIYAAIISVMGVSTILNLSGESIFFFIKYIVLLSIVYILLYKVHPHNFSDRIIKFPIIIGTVLSLSSIILWFLVYYGYEPQYLDVTPERFGRIDKFSYLWGDLAYVSRAGRTGISRACSFFETPSRYGNFLIFPVFISYGYFIITRRYKYLITCIICSVALILTFSLTVQLASVAAISINIFFRIFMKIREVKRNPFRAGIVGLLMSVIIILGIFNFFQFQYSQSSTKAMERFFRSGSYESMFRSFVHMEGVFIPDLNKPFGGGLANTKDGALYTPQYGFVRWVVLLGYPGVIVFLIFHVYMFKNHVFPALLYKPCRIERYVALAFVAQTICDVQEGSWLYTTYLYTTAMLVLLRKYEFKEWKGFQRMPNLIKEGRFKKVAYNNLVKKC